MAFDKTLPIEGALAPTYNNIMRADKTALEAALNAYMYFATGGTQTGQPRQGSARPYFQDSAPATRLDGDHFDSTDLGTPWIDSNADPDNQYNILTAADGAGNNTWTPISTEIIAVLLAANRIFAGTLKSTGDFTVGDDKLTVAAATGNTAIAGTLGVTGISILGDGSKNATSAAPDADAEFANKKYVDDHVGHDGDGYVLRDIDGTPTKVYTKYLTGSLDADDTTNVAHGIADVNKILHVSVLCWDDTANVYRSYDNEINPDIDESFRLATGSTNVTISVVGSYIQGNAYRIKIDYYL